MKQDNYAPTRRFPRPLQWLRGARHRALTGLACLALGAEALTGCAAEEPAPASMAVMPVLLNVVNAQGMPVYDPVTGLQQQISAIPQTDPATGATYYVDAQGNRITTDANNNAIARDDGTVAATDASGMEVTAAPVEPPPGGGGAGAAGVAGAGSDPSQMSAGAAGSAPVDMATAGTAGANPDPTMTAGAGTSNVGDPVAGTTAVDDTMDPVEDPAGDGPPAGLPGVVVLLDYDDQTFECVPTCSSDTVDSGDDTDDDWGSENDTSCVLPSSETGQNQPCTTGGELPAPTPRPGVVISDETDGARCEPLCQIVTTMAADTDDNPDDGWYWENNHSCVIPDSVSGSNQGCTTGDPLPDPEPRPGIIVDGAECTPLCQVVTEPSSTDEGAEDWGWENNESCVLPGTPTSTDREECSTNVFIDYTPASPTCKTQDGFTVSGGQLLDACGKAFVMRGVNNPHYWADIGGAFDAYRALDDISQYGTNTIRVVWETGESGSPALLAQILARVVQLQMIPMVELHDVTGEGDNAGLLRMADYYAQDDVKEVLEMFREYLLVNIANEWSGNDWVGGYTAAINRLRDAGVDHTLVIDANNWGQNGQVIIDQGAQLMSADPLGNLLFSVHMYGEYADGGKVSSLFSQAKSAGLPLIVGEFGWQHSGTNVAWQTILSEAQSQGIGWLAWSWYGNDAGDAPLNMVDGWEGNLTSQWGQPIMDNIVRTSSRAGVFE